MDNNDKNCILIIINLDEIKKQIFQLLKDLVL